MDADIEAFRLIATKGTRVRYVPGHAEGDSEHPDCMDGTVHFIGKAVVQVAFDKHKPRPGGQLQPVACSPEDLRVLIGP